MVKEWGSISIRTKKLALLEKKATSLRRNPTDTLDLILEEVLENKKDPKKSALVWVKA